MKKISLLIALSSTAFAFAETAERISLNDNLTWTDAEASITGGWPSFEAGNNETDGSFTYAATNGTLTISDMPMVGSWNRGFTDKKYDLNILGTGNTVIMNDRFDIGANSGSNNSGNKFTATIASSNASSVNTLEANKIYLFSGASGSTEAPEKGSVATLKLDGNAVVQGKGEQGGITGVKTINIELNYDENNNTINGGSSQIVFSNSNNKLYANDLRMYRQATYHNNPKAIIDLGGTNNEIHIKWFEVNINKYESVASIIKLSAGNKFTVGYDTQASGGDSRINVQMQDGLNFKDVYNAKTGELSNGSMFLFEAGVKDGNADVTTVEFNKNNTDKGNVINAFIVLDLTDIYGTVVGEQESHLFDFSQFDEVTNKGFFKDECEYYLQIGETIVGLDEEINGVKFTGVDYTNGLTFNYVIPEPSTYAAIFGALALAFVAYRRRK